MCSWWFFSQYNLHYTVWIFWEKGREPVVFLWKYKNSLAKYTFCIFIFKDKITIQLNHNIVKKTTYYYCWRKISNSISYTLVERRMCNIFMGYLIFCTQMDIWAGLLHFLHIQQMLVSTSYKPTIHIFKLLLYMTAEIQILNKIIFFIKT